MRVVDLVDPNPLRGRQPEKVSLLVEYVSSKDPTWGVLECLRGTSWESGIKEIAAEAISHALHGRLLPLLRELGRDPQASARRVTPAEGLCGLRLECMAWDADFCKPGGCRKLKGKTQVGPPNCYQPPVERGTPFKTVEWMIQVALAWREGRHVVVVRGDGFNIG